MVRHLSISSSIGVNLFLVRPPNLVTDTKGSRVYFLELLFYIYTRYVGSSHSWRFDQCTWNIPLFLDMLIL
jgi:hypothetical protein